MRFFLVFFFYSCKTITVTDLKTYLKTYPFNNNGIVELSINKKKHRFFIHSSFDQDWILTSTIMGLSFTLKISSNLELEGTTDPSIIKLIKIYEDSLKIFFKEIQHLKLYGNFCEDEQEDSSYFSCQGQWQKEYPYSFQYNEEKILFHKKNILFSSSKTSNTIQLVF